MSATSGAVLGGVLLLVAAGASLWDLRSDERNTIVAYTTPALRDLLEKDVVPRFERATGLEVSLIYVPAGQQYNRLRMAGEHAEADLFLHASPLYLEKGLAEGHIDPLALDVEGALGEEFRGTPLDRGRAWWTFAWSPLVEVYGPSTADAPDLASTDASFGFAHPVLSNNGIYNVLLFEDAGPDVAQRALANTKTQPTNARATIGGVADGSFDLTLGYEAVVRFYQDQGAKVGYDVPLVAGERVTTPVLCSVALISGDRHPHAETLARFLFTNETQDALATYWFRSVRADATTPDGLVDLAGARTIHYDWTTWAQLESKLSDYEVK